MAVFIIDQAHKLDLDRWVRDQLAPEPVNPCQAVGQLLLALWVYGYGPDTWMVDADGNPSDLARKFLPVEGLDFNDLYPRIAKVLYPQA